MDTERRKFMRFLITLRVKAGKENNQDSFGLIKDFSREGLKAIFDDFDFNPHSCIDLQIQRLSKDIFIPASGEVIWKRPIEGKWEVGVKLKEFSSQAKAEILEEGYNNLLKDKVCVSS